MSPVRLFVICILVRLVMLVFEIGMFSFSVGYQTIIYIVFLFVMVYSGYLIGNGLFGYRYRSRRGYFREKPFDINNDWDYRANLKVIIFFAFLFSVLYAIDVIFIKQVNLAEGLAVARNDLSQPSDSVLASLFRGFMFLSGGFGIIGVVFAFYLKTQITRKMYACLLVAYIIPIALTLTTGVRNFSVFSVLFGVIAYFSDPYRGAKKRSNKLVFALIPVCVLFVVLIIFQQRVITYRRFTVYDAILSLSNDSGFKMLDFLLEGNIPEPVSWFLVTLVMLYEYLSHGLYVLNDILSSSVVPGPYFGSYNFNIFFRLLSKIGFGGITAEDINFDLFLYGFRPGSYNTLFGAAILDFGVVGSLFFIFILVIFSQFVYRAMQADSRERRFTALHLLNCYFCLLFVVSFLYSIFDISIGGIIPLDILIISLIPKGIVKTWNSKNNIFSINTGERLIKPFKQ